MDFISHLLTGKLASKLKLIGIPLTTKAVLLGSVIPDVGEILLQIELSRKNKTTFGVYDHRTSDAAIASELNITWLYDISHSIPFMVSMFILAKFASGTARPILHGFGIGLATHVLLDSFTHGHVWALKLFFPFSNKRYKILENSIGNWWDWTPKIEIPFLGYGMPLACIVYWFVIALIIFLNIRFYNRNFHS